MTTAHAAFGVCNVTEQCVCVSVDFAGKRPLKVMHDPHKHRNAYSTFQASRKTTEGYTTKFFGAAFVGLLLLRGRAVDRCQRTLARKVV